MCINLGYCNCLHYSNHFTTKNASQVRLVKLIISNLEDRWYSMGISNPDTRNSCLENQQENNKYSVFANVTSQRSWIIKAILEESVLWTSKEWRLLLKFLVLLQYSFAKKQWQLRTKSAWKWDSYSNYKHHSRAVTHKICMARCFPRAPGFFPKQ